MKVILVRHAETEWNSQRRIQGHKDSPLTVRGERETSVLVKALADVAYPIECIFSSPLGRAWHMGQALAGQFHCPLVSHVSLKEQAFGLYEGMALEVLQRDYPHEAKALFVEDPRFCPPGGESLERAAQRLFDFLQQQEKRAMYETLCVVTHGQVCQGVLAWLKKDQIDNFSRYAQPNASYSVFELSDGQCHALHWGIATHLCAL